MSSDGPSATGPMTAPLALYRDPNIFEAERQLIFARTWQFVGLESDLGRTGDYIAQTIAGYPVVVVRDQGGVLKAYHNVCRHRAGPLVGEARGRCPGALVCRYHGWRYGFDGGLQAAPNFDPAEIDLGAYSLFPIRVETWRGFVFVNLDEAAGPLADTMRPLDACFGRRAHLTARIEDTHSVASNWKVFVENYLEGFHSEGVHGGVDAAVHAGVDDVRIDGDVVMQDVESGEARWDDDGHDHHHAHGLWAWVWPNLGLTLNRGVLLVIHMKPVGAEATELSHIYLHEPEEPGIDAAHLTTEKITEEDAWICERVQENIDAGIYRQGPLSPSHESAVSWFQARIAKLLEG